MVFFRSGRVLLASFFLLVMFAGLSFAQAASGAASGSPSSDASAAAPDQKADAAAAKAPEASAGDVASDGKPDANAQPAAGSGNAAAGDAKPETAASSFIDNPFAFGNNIVTLTYGVNFPLFMFGGDSTTMDTDLNISFINLGGLSYQFFLGQGWSVGGNVTIGVHDTIGLRRLGIGDLSAQGAYWWSFHPLPIELELYLNLGAYIMNIGDTSVWMVGPMARLGTTVYWRPFTSWSFGLDVNYTVIPEIHTGDYAGLTRIGNFLSVGPSVVYHF